MPVTETLMKPGSFQVNFVEETPYSVRAIFHDGNKTGDVPYPAHNINDPGFGFFGHLFVTPVRLGTSEQTLANLLASARYTGVMNRRLARGIAGWGLLMYLGVNDEIGPRWYENLAGFPPAAQGFKDWVDDIIVDEWLNGPGDPPFDLGTVTDIGTLTLQLDPYLMTRRAMLEYVCGYFGGEFRVNPDNTVDAGTAADLFVTTPRVVALPKGGPKDVDLKGLEALSLDQEVDFEDLNTAFFVVPADPTAIVSGDHGGGQFKDLKGQDVTRFFQIVLDLPGFVEAFPASAEFGHTIIGPTQNARRQVNLTAGGYDIAGDVAPGDNIYVYDPVNFLFDTDNQVAYGGRTIFPMIVRASSVTWPIQQGMGVYYRVSGGNNEGLIVDLSDYVAYEGGSGSGGATVEVAPRRPLGPRPALPSQVPSRVFP